MGAPPPPTPHDSEPRPARPSPWLTGSCLAGRSSVSLIRWFSSGSDCADPHPTPTGHVAMSGDIGGCRSRRTFLASSAKRPGRC